MRTTRLTPPLPLPLPLGAAAAAAAVVLAGCGSGTPAKTGAGSGAPAGNPAAAAYRYSACIRAHGVPGFPDPKVSQSGNGVSIIVHLPGGVNGSPAFNTAQKACQGILPGPNGSGPTPAEQHLRAQHLLAFAECMHSHGVTAFPDPTAQGELHVSMITAAGIDLHAPSVIAAARACVPASDGAVTQAAVSQATGAGGAGPGPAASSAAQSSGG